MTSQLDELINIDLAKLSVDNAMDNLGTLIDLSGDLKSDAGTNKALEWCDEIEHFKLTEQNSCLLDYYRANCCKI